MGREGKFGMHLHIAHQFVETVGHGTIHQGQMGEQGSSVQAVDTAFRMVFRDCP